MCSKQHNPRQAGVTSIFVVIIAALLFSIIALSFAGLMTREQRRSSDDELSQSAYDSAMAGVEDAKRVIIAARDGNPDALAAINARECNTVQEAGVAGSTGNSEVFLETDSGSGRELNQAYTCVKINMDSDEYELSLGEAMRSEIVPLRSSGTYDRVVVEWHKPSPTILTWSCAQDGLQVASASRLCTSASWGPATTTPTLLRAQLIAPGSSFELANLNDNTRGNSWFLYPSSISERVELEGSNRFVDEENPTPGGLPHAPKASECQRTVADPDAENTSYNCRAEIELGSNDISAGESQNALLRLTAIYSATDVRITLYNGNTVVPFNGVQPVVDSTGRANDLFRRVEARLSLTSDYTYPEAALDVSGDLCKDFYVTNSTSGPYGSSPLSCTP